MNHEVRDRIKVLSKRHPESLHMLQFMERVLEFQHRAQATVQEIDWSRNLHILIDLLQLCVSIGPSSLKERAKEFMEFDENTLCAMVTKFLEDKTATDIDRFIFLTFLGPIYSSWASKGRYDSKGWLKKVCPVCGFKPYVSYVVDEEEVEGARYLTCVMCGFSWYFNRTSCVACGNNEDHLLEYYYTEGEEYVQLQVCHRCGTYIKVLDMRVEGTVIPILDDIATVSMDLWARQRGFVRYEKNLLGL
ncbi:formate dehydrogenase accessory protein [Thermocrinis albus DSM 14484]|uniref:Formate dehydrogenase accessory protein n=1 Tax=Thermocrinis albus (strain DSM 14484 / JCM 11386 / HI 11/12) TaxID=638303 RepID=D3SLG6_THEAH|nr:formate dehydrogenase accessory protein FdhE [Thermocrinis albus]ADC89596.1 formate dehydrogenase accessory protein [Thermocrinis albus DSM 14484]